MVTLLTIKSYKIALHGQLWGKTAMTKTEKWIIVQKTKSWKYSNCYKEEMGISRPR